MKTHYVGLLMLLAITVALRLYSWVTLHYGYKDAGGDYPDGIFLASRPRGVPASAPLAGSKMNEPIAGPNASDKAAEPLQSQPDICPHCGSAIEARHA